MTDQQLKQAQELKRIIATLAGELEKFDSKTLPIQGINVFLPNVGTLIDDIRQVFLSHRDLFNKRFKEL